VAFGIPRDPEAAMDRAVEALQLARSGRGENLERAVAMLRSVLEVPHLYAEDRADVELFLGMALLGRAETTGFHAAGSDLDEAITHLRQAAATGDSESALRAIGWLGMALDKRSEATGSLDDLDAAIANLDYAARVASSVAPTSLTAADRFGWLGSALYRRWRLTGDISDLHRAVSEKRRAIAVTTDSRTRCAGLAALSAILLSRADATGDTASVDEAIELARQAIDLDRDDPEAIDVLGRALVARFQQTRDAADLAAATSALEHAMELVPADAQRRLAMAADLAGARVLHADRYGDRRALEDAIRLFREALRVPLDDQSLLLVNLAGALLVLHDVSGEAGALDEAIETCQRAARVARTPALRATARRRLAEGLLRRHVLSQDPTDRAAAREAVWEVALTHDTISPTTRLAAATECANLSAEMRLWDEAASGYSLALELRADLNPLGLGRSDQESLVIGAGRTASEAAAVELNRGDFPAALRALERGRGVLLTTTISLDRGLVELDAAAPNLAGELRQTRETFNATSPDTDARHVAGQRWVELVRQVRQHRGFEDFLRPPTPDDQVADPNPGPVVIINLSRYRCDALVAHGAQRTVIPLPDLRQDDAAERAARFSEATVIAENHAVGLVERLTAQDTVRATLAWLWEKITHPVLEALGFTAMPLPGERWPRLWWSPTGPLSRLPLQASGHDTGPSVLDRVVSSYTPTLHFLAQVRRRPVPFPSLGRRLVVAIEETDGHPSLQATRREASRLLTRPGAVPLVGPMANRRNVLRALPTCDSAHFACHAYSDPAHPSTSHLVLYDHSLSMVDIEKLGLPHAQLAYLSACSTANGGTRLLDEALHLGSAFTLAGFRHVVATLWQVDDETAADIAHTFYRNLEPADRPWSDDVVATALHQAIRRARDQQPRLPSRWSAHIHTGP
jgi:tetratricopeptide (TPR) repeat protein